MAILNRLSISGGLLCSGIFAGLLVINHQQDWLSNHVFGRVKSLTQVIASSVSPVQQTYYKWQDKDQIWHYSEQPNVFASNKTVTVNLAANILPSANTAPFVDEPESRMEKWSLAIKKSAFVQQIMGMPEKNSEQSEKHKE